MAPANRLFYGDNLDILRNHDYFPNECVDLVYLDPPFNSSRSYNVLFKDESGTESEAQITAFEDTWHWGMNAEATYRDLVTQAAPRVSTAVEALRTLIGSNQMMAYLVMMTARLVELHRVLKPTGSLYLHCDPTASHYLKVILDTIFGPENFVNEIIWKRTSAHSDIHQGALHLGRIHDVILFYAKSEHQRNAVYQNYDPAYVKERFNQIDETTGRRFKTSDMTGPGGVAKGNPQYEVLGVTRYWRYSQERMQQFLNEGRVYQSKPGAVPRLKQYLDEMPGIPLQDIWDDIPPINSMAQERLGYPTQKPLSLLERIISASSNPGDIVLDPFCGCGTAIAAAQKLDRRWIGIDITHLSVALMKYRLDDMFGLKPGAEYEVIGEPGSLDGARQLALDDRFQFQFWALSLIQARPLGGEVGSREGKRGSDRGVDGLITFIDESKGAPKRVIVQVKSGKVKSGDIRDLVGTVEREKAAIGIFITLEAATRDMITEAASAGFYHSPGWNEDYPKIQIMTIENLLAGQTVNMPPASITFKQAERVKNDQAHTLNMFEE